MKKGIVFLLTLFIVCSSWNVVHASDSHICTTLEDSNEDMQDYYNWSKPMYSYFTKTSEGWMRFIVDDGINGYLVDYFDDNYTLQNRMIVKTQLPIFGAFYASERHYYIVSGKENSEENDSAEVIRVSKYDKQWNHIKDCKISGINTTVPFDAGSVCLDDDGTYLLIRTAHEMYQSSDGYNHQSNLTLQIKMNDMTLSDSFHDVLNINYGYVSHSFNQFVKLDGQTIYAVDHGDAYPRSIVLTQYHTNYKDGKFTRQSIEDKIDYVESLTFPGEIGVNYTGAAVGGFEVSDSHFLIAYHSVAHDDNYGKSKNRDVYISAIHRQTNEVKTYQFTKTKSTDETSTPQLVKVNENQFMLMYEVNQKVHAILIDQNGEAISDTYQVNASLSDCQPVSYDNNVYWYTYNKNETNFYKLNSKTGKLSKTTVDTGHQLSSTSKVSDGYRKGTCKNCNKEFKIACITDVLTYWERDNDGYYYNYYDGKMKVNETIDFIIYYNMATADKKDIKDEIVVTVSDKSVLQVDIEYDFGTVKALKDGVCVVTFASKYQPSEKQNVIFHVGDSLAAYKVKNFTVKQKDYKTLKLSWDNVKHAQSYKIYLYDEKKDKNVYVTTVKENSYQASVTTGVKYTYRVMPVLKIKDYEFTGKLSSKKSATTTLSGTLKVSLTQLSGAKIKLKWNKISGATSYLIYRKNGNGSYKKIKTLSSSSTTYTSDVLKPNTYSFKVQPERYASNVRVKGDKSNSVSVKTYVDSPTISVKKKTSTSVNVSWKKVDGADKYQIYRKKTKTGTYKRIYATSKTSMVDTKLKKNVKYFYKVRAYTKVNNQAVFSKFSSVKSIQL